MLSLTLTAVAGNGPVEIAGTYPHLAMFNQEGECGTGAVVPWADRLWVVTYGPHQPMGSSDRLYEITPSLEQIIRPESIGGTPANRMIHRESSQLFIGPYAIHTSGVVRAIPYQRMYGRPTGTARHLTDASNKVVYATMEEGIYSVNVHSLAVETLWTDEQIKGERKAHLPGYHGKGFYSAQGHYIYANNGEHGREALTNPATPSGVLAEWNGQATNWTIVRRAQFTEVTGPGGIDGSTGEDDRVWSIGWDHRSLILMLRERGHWHAYRLPKTSHCYDGAHGWNTEWPRIRDIGDTDLLMTMHGSFWRFPRTFSTGQSAGLAPRSTYLRVIGDFGRWQDRVVFGCDDAARNEFLNKHPLKGSIAGPEESHSNLWFVEPSALDSFGPPLGRGGPWVRDAVEPGGTSEPFLFPDLAYRSLMLMHGGTGRASFRIEFDRRGDNRWSSGPAFELDAGRSHRWIIPEHERASWVRIVCESGADRATAWFEFRARDPRGSEPDIRFNGLARSASNRGGGLLHAVRAGRALQIGVGGTNGVDAVYTLDERLSITPSAMPTNRMESVALPPSLIHRDAASAYFESGGRRLRIPVAEAGLDPGVHGLRVCREVCTERNLVQAFGTFFEMPASNAGGFYRIRPIASHPFFIQDFTSYRGLLVFSGTDRAVDSSPRLRRAEDGRTAVWVGVVDDLWHLGKPRGVGGPWNDTPVIAGVASDPYLLAGYDRKTLSLSHNAAGLVVFRLEIDVTGDGDWVTEQAFSVGPGKGFHQTLDPAVAGYWLRLVADQPCRATAQLTYH